MAFVRSAVWYDPTGYRAVLALVQRYVALNRQTIDHWNELTDGVELARALKPLRLEKSNAKCMPSS